MVESVHIRQAIMKDVPEIIRVENETWPLGEAATEEMFRSRIEVFPQGVFVAEYQERLVGVVAFQRMHYNLDTPISTWKEATDNGMIAASHSPEGETIFGIDLSATPMAPPKTGTRLLAEVGRYAIYHNLKYGILGGRIPNYSEHSNKMTPDEYLKARNAKGEPLDPEVRFYKRAGLKIGKVIPGYFDDPASLSYGVLLIWENPFYVKNRVLAALVKPLAIMGFHIYVRVKM